MKRCLLRIFRRLPHAIVIIAGGTYNTVIKRTGCLVALVFWFSGSLMAQKQIDDDTYIKTITERAAKIANTLQLVDSTTYQAVLRAMVKQYRAINSLHESEQAEISTIKNSLEDISLKNEQIKQAKSRKQLNQDALHQDFINALSQILTARQIDMVKDGMTYNLLAVTYNAYVDMIPSLTVVEKEQLRSWLTEAREMAMDAASSDAKHAVFGKYKGRINNYLSERGYNLQKEREAWQQRLQAKSNNPKLEAQ